MFKLEKGKELRLNIMLFQVEFANIINVVPKSVNRYENDKSNPTFKVQRKNFEPIKKYEIEV